MDPNACVSTIDHSHDLDSRIEAAAALLGWLVQGGFAPKHPILTDTRAVRAVLRSLLAQWEEQHGEPHELADLGVQTDDELYAAQQSFAIRCAMAQRESNGD
jgi:hypothetical protein